MLLYNSMVIQVLIPAKTERGCNVDLFGHKYSVVCTLGGFPWYLTYELTEPDAIRSLPPTTISSS